MFSPLIDGKQNTLKFSEKKTLCYLLWIGRWPPRSSQYKRKILVLATRIKLPHPSKAKREIHKSVNNPRRYLMAPIMYWNVREKRMWVFEMHLPSASSYTRYRAQERPNMERAGTSPPVRPMEGIFLTSQIPRKTWKKNWFTNCSIYRKQSHSQLLGGMAWGRNPTLWGRVHGVNLPSDLL